MFGKITGTYSGGFEVDITTKTLPESMPLTTDSIENLMPGHAIVPGSSMIITSTGEVYILSDLYSWDLIA